MRTDNLIVFYISSHGFGHMTRCLAIIEEILKKTNYIIYIACGKFQNDFARFYVKSCYADFADRVIFRDLTTDVGLVNFNCSLKVDAEQLENELTHFVSCWERIVEEECEFLKQFKIKCVIIDISPIGALIGDKLKVKSIGISNFTWVEQYENIGINSDIIWQFKEAYSKLDCFIEYDLSLPMDLNIKNRRKIGFISRSIDLNKVEEIKQKYGKSIFITCGKSANLENINVKNFDGCIFTTSGINITGDCNVIKLPVSTLATHNYIASSNVVIAKAGWSTISEALIAKRKLVLIERDDVVEDTFNISELKKRKSAVSIRESDLRELDMDLIEQKINEGISEEMLNKYDNQIEALVGMLDL